VFKFVPGQMDETSSLTGPSYSLDASLAKDVSCFEVVNYDVWFIFTMWGTSPGVSVGYMTFDWRLVNMNCMGGG